MKQTTLNYVRAKTPEALKAKCLANSVTKGFYYKYNVVHDGKEWFAWYEEDASEILIDGIKASEVSGGPSDK
jgi:hypothetical protein